LLLSTLLTRVMLATLALKEGFRQFLIFLSLRVLAVAITTCVLFRRLRCKRNSKAFRQGGL
jgi:hypothetical protein